MGAAVRSSRRFAFLYAQTLHVIDGSESGGVFKASLKTSFRDAGLPDGLLDRIGNRKMAAEPFLGAANR